MIEYLLMLVPSYRVLRISTVEAHMKAAIQERQVETLLDRNEQLHQRLEKTLRCLNDYMALRESGMTIHGELTLPERPPEVPIEEAAPRKRHARDAAREADAQFDEEYSRMMQQRFHDLRSQKLPETPE